MGQNLVFSYLIDSRTEFKSSHIRSTSAEAQTNINTAINQIACRCQLEKITFRQIAIRITRTIHPGFIRTQKVILRYCESSVPTIILVLDSESHYNLALKRHIVPQPMRVIIVEKVVPVVVTNRIVMQDDAWGITLYVKSTFSIAPSQLLRVVGFSMTLFEPLT